MRTKTVRMRLWLGIAVAAIAAVVATGASGVTGRDKITTIAGGGLRPVSSGDGGPAIRAGLAYAMAIAVDKQRNLYVVDGIRVRRINRAGIITTIAGRGTIGGFSGDGGPATSAQLRQPTDVAVDGRGNIYIADRGNSNVRKVGPDGIITTIAGTGECRPDVSGDGGPATSAPLCLPQAVAVDARGNVYIAEYAASGGADRVRKVSVSGIITTVAGTGVPGFSGDGGPATSARLRAPNGLALDAKGNLYIADFANARVRKVTPGGRITTFAGSGKYGFSGDGGPAKKAGLLGRNAFHQGLAVDRQGNVYITDGGNYRVRKVTRSGIITTIAGAGLYSGPAGFTGDGGPAAKARLWGPNGVAVDSQGNVYIADSGGTLGRDYSARIRKVTVRR